MASALSGSARTRAMALLSVLNKKWGRMRDCNSASRAVVAAGVCALARQYKPASSMLESNIPAAALAVQGVGSASPISASRPQPYNAAAAPSVIPASHWSRGMSRCNHFLSPQAAINQARVAGSAPPVSSEKRSSQSIGCAAPNMAPTPTTLSTNITARNTTPTWQASNMLTRTDSAGSLSAAGMRPPCKVDSPKAAGSSDIR